MFSLFAGKRARRGATLIEVLIAIMVTSMLSGMVLLYGSGGRKQVNVYVETVKLAQVIVRAKSQAVSIYYNPSSPTCGYGVKLDPSTNSYFTFRYTTASVVDCASVTDLDDASIEEMQRYPLVKGLTFGAAPEQVQEILFVPPDPRTHLWSGQGKLSSSVPGEIQVTSEDGSASRVITITTGGQISY